VYDGLPFNGLVFSGVAVQIGKAVGLILGV
jgi:hypothetical protein